jgi:hypothetical protein
VRHVGHQYQIENFPRTDELDLGGYFHWTGTNEIQAGELMASELGRDSAHDEARDFLLDILKDGSRLQKDIEAEAKAAGLSVKTLYRAKSSLKVRSQKQHFSGRWEWTLPSKMATHGKLTIFVPQDNLNINIINNLHEDGQDGQSGEGDHLRGHLDFPPAPQCPHCNAFAPGEMECRVCGGKM